MNDTIDMETSKQPTGAEKPGPKGQSKESEEPVKNQTSPPPPADPNDQSPDTSAEEEPGTFDRVYEHGRQMGF